MDQTTALWPGWETKKEIGKGSYGVVYEIERNVFGHKEQAALKVLSVPQSDEEYEELQTQGYDDESITRHFEGYLQEIVREYNLMADMKGCVNIIYCDDIKYVQRDNGIGWQIFIKMELLTPLNKVLGKDTSLPDEKVIRLGIDICNALSYCEKRKILHRDIKPQNIFVSPDGTFKLGDFGVAKSVEHTAGATVVGTYNYMAPEVFNGNQPYDTKVDQYSLGLVLYWLLNERRLPFFPLPPIIPTRDEEEEGRRRRYSGEPVPMPKHGSKELKEIVLKACAFSPEDRYSSAAEMQRALERLQLKLQAGEILKEEPEEDADKTILKPVAPPVKPIITKMPERETPELADGEETALKRPARLCPDCGNPLDSMGKCPACSQKAAAAAPVETEMSTGEKKSKKPVIFTALGGVAVAAAVLLAVLLSGKNRKAEPLSTVEEPPAVMQEATEPEKAAEALPVESEEPAVVETVAEPEPVQEVPENVKHYYNEALGGIPELCSVCSGDGVCLTCGGSGEDESSSGSVITQKCSTCGGSGSVTNKSTATCGSCGGKGYTGGSWNDSGQFVRGPSCGKCGGSGVVTTSSSATCGTCSGKGKVTYTRGKNYPLADCETCKGSGHCASCDGVGMAASELRYITESDRFYAARVGDTVVLGRVMIEAEEPMEDNPDMYEVTVSAMEWQVLAKKEGKLLLLCNSTPGIRSYNSKKANITWEKSSLRTWLNGSFLKDSFSEEEQALLLTTAVSNAASQGFETGAKGGKDTKDKVFLLSYAELMQYLPEGRALPESTITEMVQQAFLKKNPSEDASSEITGWWLRSPGETQSAALAVSSAGEAVQRPVNGSASVRPAMWVTTE